MKTELFDYYLPESLIAQFGLQKRDQSRLLLLNRHNGEIIHTRFIHLVEFLKPGDHLILNNTRVIPSRLKACLKKNGYELEIFLLHKRDKDRFECMVKPGKKMPAGAWIQIRRGDHIVIEGEVMQVLPNGNRIIRFQGAENVEGQLFSLGEIPLPPYIKRPVIPSDYERYQTIYSEVNGSVAAPTAGLHFTSEILSELTQKNVRLDFLTLHVGTGTFKPVKTENIEDHPMEEEAYFLPHGVVKRIVQTKKEGHRIIAVGTTCVRVLETIFSETRSGDIEMKDYEGWTKKFIYPPYQFRMVDGVLTNFHLPKSTLLMLVCALGGYQNVMTAYQMAVKRQYRFYSFGDAMLIL